MMTAENRGVKTMNQPWKDITQSFKSCGDVRPTVIGKHEFVPGCQELLTPSEIKLQLPQIAFPNLTDLH